MALGPCSALHAVLDFIVDNYQLIAAEFERELDTLEHDIFAESYKRGTIRRLYELRKELTQMRMSVAPMQDSAGQELVMMQRTLAKIEETIAQTQDAASPDSKSQLEQLIRQRDQLKAAIAEMSAKEKEGDAVQPKPVPAPQKPIPQKPGQDAPVKKQ